MLLSYLGISCRILTGRMYAWEKIRSSLESKFYICVDPSIGRVLAEWHKSRSLERISTKSSPGPLSLLPWTLGILALLHADTTLAEHNPGPTFS